MKEKGENMQHALAIETIAATCGLIHDLGNPPFGHAGELAMRQWFQERAEDEGGIFAVLGQPAANGSQGRHEKDFLSFEGNAQTIRLVSKLQVLADLHGLNFTSATASAACKYVAASDAIDDKCHERSKLGYFVSEEDLIDRVRRETGTGRARNPIAFLVEACDDAVYSVVDLEDGVKKKVITWEQLEGQLREQHEGDPQVLERCLDRAKNMLASREPTQAGLQIGDEERAVAFRVYAIGAMVEAAIEVFKANYDSVMAGKYHRELLADSDAASLCEVCKKVGLERVYRAEPNLRKELMGKRIICDLMDILAEGAMAKGCGVEKANKFARKAYQLMSSNYRIVFEAAIAEGKLPREYCCMQLVTDYICGMTDTFACVLHRQLTNG